MRAALPARMRTAVSRPPCREVSQHRAALVARPKPIVTIFDSSGHLPANLGPGGGKAHVLTHILVGCETQRSFAWTNNISKISKLPQNGKADKAQTSQSWKGVVEAMG